MESCWWQKKILIFSSFGMIGSLGAVVAKISLRICHHLNLGLLPFSMSDY